MPECNAKWFDEFEMYESATCEEFYDMIDDLKPDDWEDDDDECDDFWCDESDDDEDYSDDDSDDDDEWWNDDEDHDDCENWHCTESMDCLDRHPMLDECSYYECQCEEGDMNDHYDSYECNAQWSLDGERYEGSCDEGDDFVECLDWDHSMDECHFGECDEHGDCWEEICNEHSESHCAQPSCTLWQYNHERDFWMQDECPEPDWQFGDYYSHFAHHYNGTFKEIAQKTCPHGQCFHNFTDDYIPFFDENDEEIDAFLADDEAVDQAHEAVSAAEKALDVDLDIIHGFLEQEDHEDVKDAIDGAMKMWAFEWMHSDVNSPTTRKGSRNNN